MAKGIISNTNLIFWRIFKLVFIVMGCLSACQSIVPAVTPPQLNHTPSAPIIITDTQIDVGWFSLDYPDNWRVVTNIASEPLHLIVISPDDSIIIHVEDARDECVISDTEQVWRNECIADNNARLMIWLEQNSHLLTQDETIFEALIDSIRFR